MWYATDSSSWLHFLYCFSPPLSWNPCHMWRDVLSSSLDTIVSSQSVPFGPWSLTPPCLVRMYPSELRYVICWFLMIAPSSCSWLLLPSFTILVERPFLIWTDDFSPPLRAFSRKCFPCCSVLVWVTDIVFSTDFLKASVSLITSICYRGFWFRSLSSGLFLPFSGKCFCWFMFSCLLLYLFSF